MPVPPASLSGARRAILEALKQEGPSTIGALARRLGVSGEAVRQHLALLEREGWVERVPLPWPRRSAGRPPILYRLTREGDHAFPKQYPRLAVALLDAVAQSLGEEALHRVLARLAEDIARAWEPRLQGMDLEQRLQVLREIYAEEDPFAQVERTPEGIRLVERNCPFLEVALQRPALCSVTVSVLTRLLGCRVVREERFQDGDGRCVFRVMPEHPVDPQRFGYYAPEPPREGRLKPAPRPPAGPAPAPV